MAPNQKLFGVQSEVLALLQQKFLYQKTVFTQSVIDIKKND
jgi:hypothetical protein